jgi:hypothetical protein
MIDDRDKATAEIFEATIKEASIDGIPGYTSSIMTEAQYEPTDVPGVDATLPRDSNRDTGASIAHALRLLPFRLPSYTVASVPAAANHTGAIVYVVNGAAGSPVPAFSDGSNWLRVDTKTAISSS